MKEFKLRKELEENSVFICDLALCQLRLNQDGDLDWFILVPRRSEKKDWSDLSLEDQFQLTTEINQVCKIMQKELSPDKLNVASLGNQVSQLHIHIIARYENDRAWPGAIFGISPIKDFDRGKISYWTAKLAI